MNLDEVDAPTALAILPSCPRVAEMGAPVKETGPKSGCPLRILVGEPLRVRLPDEPRARADATILSASPSQWVTNQTLEIETGGRKIPGKNAPDSARREEPLSDRHPLSIPPSFQIGVVRTLGTKPDSGRGSSPTVSD